MKHDTSSSYLEGGQVVDDNVGGVVAAHLVALRIEVGLGVVRVLAPPCAPRHEARKRLLQEGERVLN